MSREVFTRLEVDSPKGHNIFRHRHKRHNRLEGCRLLLSKISRGSGSSAGVLDDSTLLVDPSLSKASSVSWLTADLDSRVCRTTGLLLTDSLTDSKLKVTESFSRIELRISRR